MQVRFYDLKENPVVKAGTLGKGKVDEMAFWTKEEDLQFIVQVKDKPVSITIWGTVMPYTCRY